MNLSNIIYIRFFMSLLMTILFMTIPPLSNASLDTYPTLYATLNGQLTPTLYPGFGIVEDSGVVSELQRMTALESQNSYSAFGITRNSVGEYWTSTGNALVQFDENTGDVLQSLGRVNEAFLNIVFDPSDRLYGWSNGNGYLCTKFNLLVIPTMKPLYSMLVRHPPED